MGLSENRRIKSFTEVITRIFMPAVPGEAEGRWTGVADTPIDEQVNQWVEKEGVIILQVMPSWSQMPDSQDEAGQLIRRAILRYVVVYTTEHDYFETETRIRRMSMLGEGLQPPMQSPMQSVPQDFVTAPLTPKPVRPAAPTIDSDAGGPPGVEKLDDDHLFRGATG